MLNIEWNTTMHMNNAIQGLTFKSLTLLAHWEMISVSLNWR